MRSEGSIPEVVWTSEVVAQGDGATWAESQSRRGTGANLQSMTLLLYICSQVEFKRRHGHLSVSTDKDSVFYVRSLGGWVNAQVRIR